MRLEGLGADTMPHPTMTSRGAAADNIEELPKRNTEGELGGGIERLERQCVQGKKTVHERNDLLLGRKSFQTMNLPRKHGKIPM